MTMLKLKTRLSIILSLCYAAAKYADEDMLRLGPAHILELRL